MSESSTAAQGGTVTPGNEAGLETIDTLIRHLETAKRVYASAEPGVQSVDDGVNTLLTPDTICTLFYGTSGTFCPLFYIHTS